jgi:ribosomal-protein-alanine N-acetyltransferase
MNPQSVPADVQIRRMWLEDVSQVHALDKQSFSLPWTELSFRYEIVENQAARCWVAEFVDGEVRSIVGMLVLWIIVDEAHIGTIAVSPQFRRHGIGRRILASALLGAYEDGARQALLEVRRSNLAAQELYRRFGFEEDGMRRHYYRDNGEDAILMGLHNLQPETLQIFL